MVSKPDPVPDPLETLQLARGYLTNIIADGILKAEIMRNMYDGPASASRELESEITAGEQELIRRFKEIMKHGK